MNLSPTIPQQFLPIVQEAVEDLQATGTVIPNVEGIRFCFNVSMRPWGRYIHRNRTIQISDANMKGGTAPVRNTLVHELIHAAYPYAHHGYEFKMCAARVNAMFPGKYLITTTTAYERVLTLEQAMETFPYVTRCRKCGRFWGHRRNSRSVYNHECFRCRCGGEIERLK